MTKTWQTKAILVLGMLFSSLPGPAETPSPVILRFATVGDSRGEPGAKGNSPQDEIWLQATPVLSRILREIEEQRPQILVFNGDMIRGYTKDIGILDKQYAFWRGMVAGLMERGTYVLPVPGNHEVQVPLPQPGGGFAKRALETHEQAWRANMGDLILDRPRWNKSLGMPAAAWDTENAPAKGEDGISTDQRQLSYSLDVGPVHLAIINTDPVGFDGSVPLKWLQRDLGSARARGSRHIFVFGHKMPFTYFPNATGTAKEDGLEGHRELRDAFWDLIESSGATYICGHQHVYHASQPRRDHGGMAWQVIVGSGGSPLGIKPGQSNNPMDRMYAWALISVHQDGSVRAEVRGFDEQLGPTAVIERLELQPARN